MFYSGVAAVLLISFVFYFKREESVSTWRFDIASIRPIRYLLSRRWLQFAFQLPLLILFILVLYAGFFGDARINIAPVLTWTIWWGLLIFVVLLAGKFWCFACPWDLLASLASRLRFWSVNKEPLTLGIRWPKWGSQHHARDWAVHSADVAGAWLQGHVQRFCHGPYGTGHGHDGGASSIHIRKKEFLSLWLPRGPHFRVSTPIWLLSKFVPRTTTCA